MEEQYYDQNLDLNSHIRDLEEKQRLLRDRVLLLGKTLVEERSKSFAEMQEMKKTILRLNEENIRTKELLMRVAERLENTARKEELMILKRQFDLFRT